MAHPPSFKEGGDFTAAAQLVYGELELEPTLSDSSLCFSLYTQVQKQ